MAKGIRNSLFLSSLAYAVLGIILVLLPGSSLRGICYAAGTVLILYGLFHVISYQRNKKKTDNYGGSPVSGTLLLAAGLFLLLFPQVIVSFLPVCFGILFLIYGISEILRAFDLKRLDYKRWWPLLFFGSVSTVFGAVLFFNPFAAMETTMRIIGILLVVTAVTNIISAVGLSRSAKKWAEEDEKFHKNFHSFFWF